MSGFSRSTLVVLVLVLLLTASALVAQDFGTKISDGTKQLTLDHVLKQGPRLQPRPPAGLQWHPDGARLTRMKLVDRKPTLVAEPADGGKEETLLTQAALAEAWRAAKLKGKAPGLSPRLRWNADGKSLRMVHAGALYRVDVKPPRITRLHVLPKGAKATAFSSGDERIAFVKDWNIFVVNPDGATVPVTRGGHADLTHGISVSRSEFGIHDGLWWDPTGRRLAFYQEDLRPIALYPYADYKPTPAKLVHGRYPMAGQKGSVVKVGVFDTRSGERLWLATDGHADEYLTNITWGPKGEQVFVAHVNRGQNEMKLVVYDAKTGQAKATLFTEKDEQWTEPEHGPVFLPDDSASFLWLSPREGFDQYYLHGADGKLVRKLTPGEFDVLAFKGWDPSGKGFFFDAGGDNPLERHLFHATLEGVVQQVTQGRGRHQTAISADGRQVLDFHTDLDTPLAVDLITLGGKMVRRIHAAPNPLNDFKLGTQRFFSLKSKDGFDLHGHVIFPPDLDPKKKYPVIHYVYGGPHAQLVQDRWLAGSGRWILWMHMMAAKGYVVLRLDNRGTPFRGIEFEQVIHRRLGTCEIEDQTAALEWLHGLGVTDRKRVAVHGWSFGGFMTLSLMTRKGDNYKLGIAGAPVTNWAYYETGYGERYMDTPAENKKGYTKANPGMHVKGLKGRLIVVHGSSDETVMWQNTINFLTRCISAGAEVETMIYPGEKHGLRGRSFVHFIRKMTAVIDRELMERE